jgi:septal ring factor EnvC (AmiA/AmiB activator)
MILLLGSSPVAIADQRAGIGAGLSNTTSAPRAHFPHAARTMAEQLEEVHGQVLELESSLLGSLKEQGQIQVSIRKIKTLLSLQAQERLLAKARVKELESTVGELELRKTDLNGKLSHEQARARRLLLAIQSAELKAQSDWSWLRNQDSEVFEAPRRRMLSQMVDLSLKAMEAIRVDLADSGRLEAQIQQERAQLAALINEIQEQESILELNRQLHADVLARKHAERISQLENYRRLKKSEVKIESLLSEFSSRRELENIQKIDKSSGRPLSAQAAFSNPTGAFAVSRGKLQMPLFGGEVISDFGKSKDPKLGLTVFKKGIEIRPKPGGGSQPMKAVFGGKVAFVGVLPEYGKVAILDHGDQFYSLSARLGEVLVQSGDWVPQGSVLGRTDSVGTPVYFEIRAKNVAVNPLQWFSESSSFKSNLRSTQE